MRIEWLPEAERNLAAQIEWVAEDNPWAAIDMGDAIQTAVARLGDYPAMAGQGRVAGTRELIVVGTPYIVVHTSRHPGLSSSVYCTELNAGRIS